MSSLQRARGYVQRYRSPIGWVSALAAVLVPVLAAVAIAQQPPPPPPPPPPMQPVPPPPPPLPPAPQQQSPQHQGKPQRPLASYAVARWATYDAGTAGHVQAIAFARALKAGPNLPVAVLPNASDVVRHSMLRQSKSDYILSGLGSYFAQEGLFDYGRTDLGPQPLRLVIGSYSSNVGIAVHAASRLQSLVDLKGARVVVQVRSAASQHALEALLSFAGLTLRDVKQVPLVNAQEQTEAMFNNKADAALELTIGSGAQLMANSSRGMRWLPVPHSDAAGWKRMAMKAPYLVANHATAGALANPGRPLEGAAYPYPMLITRDDVPASVVHTLARAMLDSIASLKASVPGMEGWVLEKQRRDWVIPYHDGAIQIFQAAGLWSPQLQAHNDRLIVRQRVLKAAWDKTRQSVTAATDPTDATRIWTFTRIRMLREEGFEPWF